MLQKLSSAGSNKEQVAASGNARAKTQPAKTTPLI